MFTIFNLTILILWSVSAVIDYSEFCYIWQLKEYRWDRFRDFLTTKQGRAYWAKYPVLWRSFAAFVIFFLPINTVLVYKYLLVIFFLIDIVIQLIRYSKATICLPVRTKKALLLIFSAAIFEGAVIVLLADWSIIFILIIIRFFIFSLWVRLMQLPTGFVKKYYIRKAAQRMAAYNQLKVIGVTGSFGKTTTKEFLSYLLAGKFRVTKTPDHVNTDIGVAQYVLRTDLSEYDIFVVEMGAYRVGEIASICHIVRPQIGVLTGINEQHLSLFGSQQNIISAKYELLNALPKSGTAVINRDFAYFADEVKKLKCEVQTYGLEANMKPDVLLSKLKSVPEGTLICEVIKGEEEEFVAPIFGEHLAVNIGACRAVAHVLGITGQEFRLQVSTLKNPEKTMKRFKFGNSVVIDDSHNANPAGFMGALSTLGTFPSSMRRIVITRGMLELGKESDQLHEAVGGAIAYSADELVLIQADGGRAIKKGLGEKYRTVIIEIDTEAALKDYLYAAKNRQAVILIENRLIGGAYTWLLEQFQEL